MSSHVYLLNAIPISVAERSDFVLGQTVFPQKRTITGDLSCLSSTVLRKRF